MLHRLSRLLSTLQKKMAQTHSYKIPIYLFSKSYLFHKLHQVAKYVKFIIQMTYLTEGLTTFYASLCGILICFIHNEIFVIQMFCKVGILSAIKGEIMPRLLTYFAGNF